jgi:hypothetical protein
MSDGPEEKQACGMTLPCLAGACSTRCYRLMPGTGGDATTMLFRVPEALINIAHFQNINVPTNAACAVAEANMKEAAN